MARALPLGAALLLLVCLHCAAAVQTLDAFRLVQWTKGGQRFGSQRASMALQAGVASESSLARKALVIPLADFVAQWRAREKQGLAPSATLGTAAEGVVVIVPTNATGDLSALPDIEHWLAHNEVRVPFYFAPEAAAAALYGDVIASSRGAIGGLLEDRYQLVVSAAEGEKAPEPTLTNIQAFLPGAGEGAPTIAVVAHYDSFAASPGLTVASHTASSVAALLELARVFSKLYTTPPKLRAKYNLLFLLSGGRGLTFAGTAKWLSSVDSRLLDSIEFSLCLDSLTASDDLFLHISKLGTKEPRLQALYDALSATAEKVGSPLKIVHRKINISDPEVFWEHEQFARHRHTAATLSALGAPRGGLLAGSTVAEKTFSAAILNKRLRYVAEALASVIFPSAPVPHVFEGSLGFSEQIVESWTSALLRQARFAPFLKKTATLFAGLERALTSFGLEVSRTSAPFASADFDAKFFGPETVTLTAYKVKGVLFEVVLSITIIAYLLLLSFALMGRELFVVFAELSRLATKQKKK